MSKNTRVNPFIFLKKIFSITLIIFSLRIYSAEQLYTFSDLKILAAENSFKEYINHALDVRPSLRTNEWSTMTKNMAKLYVEDLTTHKQFSEESYKKVESLNEIPVLRSDDFFKGRRQKYLLRYFKNCLEKNLKQCERRIDLFWEGQKGDLNQSDIGIDLGRLIKASKRDKDLWPFYLPATTGTLSNYHCKKQDVKEQVFAQLANEMRSLPTNKTLQKKIGEIANGECWDLLYPELKSSLLTDNKSISFYSYRVLNLKSKLTSVEKFSYLLTYILNGPMVGETFNEGWNAIEQLGKDFKMRQDVLNKVMKLDYIPDELFNAADEMKRDVLIDLIDKNIPEFIDSYAKICLDYLEGKRKFPQGNPTKHCKTMFKLSKNKPWPGHGLKSRYNNLPKY